SLAAQPAASPEDAQRLHSLARYYREFHDRLEGRFADLATFLRAACQHLPRARWLAEAEVLVVDDLELAPLERDFLSSPAQHLPVRRVDPDRPPGLPPSPFPALPAPAG